MPSVPPSPKEAADEPLRAPRRKGGLSGDPSSEQLKRLDMEHLKQTRAFDEGTPTASVDILPTILPAMLTPSVRSWSNRKIAAACLVALVVVVAVGQRLSVEIKSDFLLRQCRQALKQGNAGAVVVQCNDALKIKADNERAYFYRGLAKLRLNDAKSAVADLRAASALGMPPPAVTEALAAASLAAGDYVNSARYCQQLFDSGKPTDDAYLTRGLSLLNMHKIDDAAADLDVARRSDNPSVKARALFGKACVEVAQKNYTEAINHLDESLREEPSQAALIRRADTLRDMGKFDDAIADYTKAVHVDKSSAELYLSRGICEAAFKREKQALADFDEALKLKPAFVEALSRRGREYLALGRYSQAIGDLQLALKLNPNADIARSTLDLATYCAAKWPEKHRNP
ncbi:MAG TPA: tetratricopeptide repeat protein [Candidatus Obscuribacterales bacterium]